MFVRSCWCVRLRDGVCIRKIFVHYVFGFSTSFGRYLTPFGAEREDFPRSRFSEEGGIFFPAGIFSLNFLLFFFAKIKSKRVQFRKAITQCCFFSRFMPYLFYDDVMIIVWSDYPVTRAAIFSVSGQSSLLSLISNNKNWALQSKAGLTKMGGTRKKL